jgi:DNA-binding MarR family transcriptional regulator
MAGEPTVAGVPVAALAGCTCLRLRKAARRVTQLYDRALAPAGITAVQFGLLATVSANDGLSVGELAAFMVMDPTTLTRNLRPLERDGLVRIVPAPGDRRRRAIAATAAGRARFRAAVPLWRTAQAEVADRLGAPDLARLDGALAAALAKLAPR